MGIDFGFRRIGVAVGSLLSGRAQPVASVDHRNGEPDWQAIEGLLAEWRPALLIVGLPGTLEGHETTMSTAARQFADTAGARFQLPVAMVDEQLSSAAAHDALREERLQGRRKRRVKKTDIDPVAARLILETWINEHSSGSGTGS